MNDKQIDEWIKFAKSNLSQADRKRKPKDVLYEDLCFNCQQCVEKSLKALLIYNNIEFPKTHSINLLLDLLISNSIYIPDFVKNSVILNVYAVITRYPNDYNKITRNDYLEALKITKDVFEWVIEIINKKNLFSNEKKEF
ncbi:MAG TPA: HEPN domain-containing protein [Spirochaetota bacterium]|nr:HEPN domain-containing protein [Spirochaetota bacterium]